jgi:hypothetical protein
VGLATTGAATTGAGELLWPDVAVPTEAMAGEGTAGLTAIRAFGGVALPLDIAPDDEDFRGMVSEHETLMHDNVTAASNTARPDTFDIICSLLGRLVGESMEVPAIFAKKSH